MNKGYRSKQYRRKFENDEDVSVSHTSYALYYHLLWAVKRRFPLITESVRADPEGNLKKKSEQLGIRLLAVGINPEHLHCIISLRPTHYIPEVAKELKGFSSHEVNKSEEEFIKWARGYSIRTVSEKNLTAAIKYVENQGRHHGVSMSG
ncbi:MAG: IS200/IS605 family transposase [Candidatus Zixiibacteriota bacterium]